MQFCPKCKGIMIPKKEGTKTIMFCPKCGNKIKDFVETKIEEKMVKEKKNVEVVDSAEFEHLPETEAECPKCNNEKAHYWTMQTRAGDEPETKFFRCTKCRHTWRDYS